MYIRIYTTLLLLEGFSVFSYVIPCSLAHDWGGVVEDLVATPASAGFTPDVCMGKGVM